MARYRGPKSKIARKFKEPILGPSKALERKNYPPGIHGKNRRSKQSEYAVQLAEKQKAKYTYGLLEKQFSNIFKKASRKAGKTGEVMLQMLETRLDNVVYRLGFTRTRRQARQLVTHCHVLVNGGSVNIPSYTLRPGDMVEIREKSKSLEVVNDSLSRNMKTLPWLELDKAHYKGRVINLPIREDIPENIREQLIVELYSK
jgi:small subunit ribosomal protein S4